MVDTGTLALAIALAVALFTLYQTYVFRNMAKSAKNELDLHKQDLELHRQELAQERKQSLGEQERENRLKLSLHYQKLCEKVVDRLATARTGTALGFDSYEQASIPIYLTTSRFQVGINSVGEGVEDKRWREWTVEHVKNEPIFGLLESLNKLENEHNEAVSLFVKNVKAELEAMTKDLIGLFPHVVYKSGDVAESRGTNYYDEPQLLKALQSLQVRNLETFQSGNQPWFLRALTDENLWLAASDAEGKLIPLREKLEALRGLHQEDYRTFSSNIDRDRELVSEINAEAQRILFEVANLEEMKGECEYERSLKHAH